MATTDLISALVIGQCEFTLDFGQEFSGVASGLIIAKDLRPALWRAKLTSSILSLAQTRQAQARLNALVGSVNSFLAWNPAGQYPQADPAGTILGASTVQVKTINADAYHISLKGLPAGYVLTIGDLLSIDHTSKGLHQVLATVTADGSGNTAEFLIAPSIAPIFAVNDVVTLKRPTAEMRIVPGSVSISVSKNIGSIALEGVQVI